MSLRIVAWLWPGCKADYWLPGGRGPTRSSFISIVIVLLIIANPKANAVVVRRLSNTLRDSAYQQIQWAIEVLGLERVRRDDTLVRGSSYLDVIEMLPDWLGAPFVEEAEYLRNTNEQAWRWEYLGEITGAGGAIFEFMRLLACALVTLTLLALVGA